MKQKLKIKDIITVTLLSLCNLVIYSLGTFLYATPITILIMPAFYALLEGIVFYMIGIKVQKRGAILLYCIIQGVFGFYLPYILLHIAAGIIGEIILAKMGYGSMKGIGISYVILQLLACVGSTIYPYVIAKNATIANIEEKNIDLGIDAAGNMITSWGMAAFVVGIVLAAVIGALIGKFTVRKHVLAAEA